MHIVHHLSNVITCYQQSCLRCLNTNRSCGGYENDGNLIFRQHEPKVGPNIPLRQTFQSIARKCSLPPRVSLSGSDTKPREVPVCAMEEFALRAFFYDYCIVPINPSFSRGFLGELERMVHQQGLQSQIAKACKAVAFASHAIKLNRPFLTRKAEELYQELLSALAEAIRYPNLAQRADTAVMAILLGLYEVLPSSIETSTAPTNRGR